MLGRPRRKSENLVWIMRRERIPGSEVVFVGDSQQDLDAACQCGCQFIGMVHNTSQFASEPPYIIRDLVELAATIEQMEERTANANRF